MSINPTSRVLPARVETANNQQVSLSLLADRFITKKEVLHLVGFSHATLYRRIKTANFPAPLKIQGASDRSPSLWSLKQIIKWQNKQLGGAE